MNSRNKLQKKNLNSRMPIGLPVGCLVGRFVLISQNAGKLHFNAHIREIVSLMYCTISKYSRSFFLLFCEILKRVLSAMCIYIFALKTHTLVYVYVWISYFRHKIILSIININLWK